jgi:hypothetical protein
MAPKPNKKDDLTASATVIAYCIEPVAAADEEGRAAVMALPAPDGHEPGSFYPLSESVTSGDPANGTQTIAIEANGEAAAAAGSGSKKRPARTQERARTTIQYLKEIGYDHKVSLLIVFGE